MPYLVSVGCPILGCPIFPNYGHLQGSYAEALPMLGVGGVAFEASEPVGSLEGWHAQKPRSTLGIWGEPWLQRVQCLL